MLKWMDANNFVRNNPVAYIFLFVIIVIIYNGIPYFWKWRKGEIQKDKLERENARKIFLDINNNVMTNSGIIRDMKNTLDKHNGNLAKLNKEFQAHSLNSLIHVKSDKIEKNQELVMEALSGVHKRIDRLYEDRAGV